MCRESKRLKNDTGHGVGMGMGMGMGISFIENLAFLDVFQDLE